MSKTVDERVVSMQFDNKQFESGVSTTLSSVDKLKQSLNFTGVSKSFDNINSAAKSVNLSGISGAVETVGLKFSALYTIADTALRNITNSAVNYGKRIASALTIDPITTGFSEYETQINAVQTILANTESKGTTLNQVNSALDELNAYADKTIYNFTEMTRNIGTFTAAGVDLETSVSAIQGIANLAAVSGSTSQQASTAMYQLSQALAAGKVSLMDWNSVVNAGMGGEVFQNALKRTSELLGTGAEEAIEKYGSFRESLTKGEWLTTEVLTETLKQLSGAYTEADLIAQGFTKSQAQEITKLAGTATDAATKVKTVTQLWDTLKEAAQSGWTQTWEYVVGDFEEAKGFLTEVSDKLGAMIGESAEKRNNLVRGGLGSEWDRLVANDGIFDEEGYTSVLTSVAKKHGVAIDEMIEKHGSFEGTLKEGWLTSDMWSEAISTAADNVRNMSDAELEAAGYTKENVSQLLALDKAIKNGTGSFDELVESLSADKATGRENLIQSLWNMFNGIMNIVAPVKEAFDEMFSMDAEQLYNFTEKLTNITEGFKTFTENISGDVKRTFKGVFAFVDIIRQAFGAVFKVITPLFGGFGEASSGILSITASLGDWLVNLNKFIKKNDVFGKALSKVADFLSTGFNKVVPVFTTITTAISNAITKAQDFIPKIRAFISTVKGRFVSPGLEALKGIFERIGERMSQLGEAADGMKSGVVIAIEAMGSALANCDFLKVMRTIWEGVKTLGSAIAEAFGILIGGVVDGIGDANFSGILDVVNSLIAGGIGIGITKFLSSVTDTFSSFQDVIDGVVDVFDGVRGCFEAYQTQLKAGTLMKIAGAIAILTAAILVASLIDSEKLSASLGAITMLFVDLMAAMSITSKIAGGTKGLMTVSTAMISMSIAVLILASALKMLSGLDPEEMFIGMVGIAGVTALMVAAAKTLSINGGTVIKGATQMVIFAAALKVMASVCRDFSNMSWEGIFKGIVAMAGSMGILVAAINLMPNDISLIAPGLLVTAAALIVITGAMALMGALSWESIAKGLVAIAGSLIAVAAGVKLMPNKLSVIAPGLIAVAAALIIITGAIGLASLMSWEGIAKGLVAIGGSMAILAVGLNAMRGTVGGAAAMLVAAAALLVLTPVLVTLGSLSWESIAKGLLTIAGAFTVIGVAGLFLTPLIPTLLGLAGAFALIGVGVLGIGAGLLAAGTGLSALAVGFSALSMSVTAGATAVVAALTIIVTGIASLIPVVVRKLGESVIVFCNVIREGAPAIGEAVKAVVLTLVDVLVECVPAIADGALKLIVGVLDALVTYTPQIVDSLFQFIIGLIDGLSANIPTLIQSLFDLVMSVFSGVIDALRGMDTSTLLKGIVGVGLMAAIMAALSAVASLVPGAMVGVLGIGAVIAEMALVLAAIGALAQIPGLDWLIGEGGDLLESIGTAIGQFVGGLVGGVAKGATASLPDIGTNLSNFMTNAQTFIDGAKSIDKNALDGVERLVEIILKLTAADFLSGITSWITGGSTLSSFGKDLVPFGRSMKQYSDSIRGINAAAVTASANAAKALAEVAANIPNSGGLVSLFTGENSLSSFASDLVPFGRSMKSYSNSIAGLDASAVTASANAAKSLAEMATNLPNSGGLVSWFTGDNTLSSFAKELVPFGRSMKQYSDGIAGLNVNAVTASTNAARSLAELATNLPNSGGMASWFTGDNTLSSFAEELVPFGRSMKSYSNSIKGIDAEAVTASANAASAIAELASNLPNSGGLVSWFTGDNNLGDFAADLIPFGRSMKQYGDAVKGIDPEAVTASANAAKTLASLAESLPNSGGVASWFAGDNKLSDFAADLVPFGKSIKSYSDSIVGVNTSMMSGVKLQMSSLADAIANWSTKDFSGANSLKTALGTISASTINNFVNAFSTAGPRITAAGKSMMTNLQTGVNSGKSLVTTAVTNAINSAVNNVSSKNSAFNSAGRTLVTQLKNGINANASSASNAFRQPMSTMLSSITGYNARFKSAGQNLVSQFRSGITSNSSLAAGAFKSPMASMLSSITGYNTQFNRAGRDLVTQVKNGISTSTGYLSSIWRQPISNMVSTITGYSSRFKSAGQNLANQVKYGIEANASKVSSAAGTMASNAASKAGGYYWSFYNSGIYMVDGFAAGITAETWYAQARASAMARAALNAANYALGIHSPSREFYKVGGFAGEGFVNALSDYESISYRAGSDMAASAQDGLSRAIGSVRDMIAGGVDSDLTIRPVLDLSAVADGADSINGMFNMTPSIGLLSSVGAINNNMNRNQNGVNDDVISAINNLGRKLGNASNVTYQIDGITYDDGSNIAEAIQALTRAVRTERRI